MRCFSSEENGWLIPFSYRCASFMLKDVVCSVCLNEFHVMPFETLIATINSFKFSKILTTASVCRLYIAVVFYHQS